LSGWDWKHRRSKTYFSNGWSPGGPQHSPCHPVDKPKGVVKGERVRRVAMSNSLAKSLETWRHASPLRESFSVEKDLPPAIDADERSVHD
jgi:hypothetical protein